MDNHRTNFEKTKSSGINRMLNYLHNSSLVVRDIPEQTSNQTFSRIQTAYEQTCVLSNAKNKDSCLYAQEFVKIPDLILCDPTNLLFGLQTSVRNPLDTYRLHKNNYEQNISKNKFITSMVNNLSTLAYDAKFDNKTNLVSLAKEFTAFKDLDTTSKIDAKSPLTTSCLPTIHTENDSIDPSTYNTNLFEPGTINRDKDVNQLLIDLITQDDGNERKLIPKLNNTTKDNSKFINIRGSTVKPKLLDSGLNIRINKPVVYGLNYEPETLQSTSTNITTSTQTDNLLKQYVEQYNVTTLKGPDKPFNSSNMNGEINKYTFEKVKIGYRDTFDTTPRMIETCSKVNSNYMGIVENLK